MPHRKIHTFDNGVMVYDDHLLPEQKARYLKRNVHEAEEEDIFIGLMKGVPENGCYINIGSAIGYYVILARLLRPGISIHAVEPLVSHRKFFTENIILNGLGENEFSIHPYGVAGTEGTASLVDASYGSIVLDDTRQHHLIEQLRARGARIYPVDVTTIDKLSEMAGQPFDLVQIDVQGLELEVLKGGYNSLNTGYIRHLLIGTHSQELHSACIEYLESLGYTIEFEEYETKQQPDGILVAGRTH